MDARRIFESSQPAALVFGWLAFRSRVTGVYLLSNAARARWRFYWSSNISISPATSPSLGSSMQRGEVVLSGRPEKLDEVAVRSYLTV